MTEKIQTVKESNSRRGRSVERVISALHDVFSASDSADSSETSVSTRDIADRSELSIYNARHILIKLEKEGVVTSVKQASRKSLYWNKTENFKF